VWEYLHIRGNGLSFEVATRPLLAKNKRTATRQQRITTIEPFPNELAGTF
jgi:hypothetical protein